MASQGNELNKQAAQLKNGIEVLRRALNKADSAKEHWFEEKEKLSWQIRNLISQIKELKSLRDENTAKVKELKEKRKQLSEPIHSKIAEVKKERNHRNELFKKLKLKKSYSALQRDISRLEEKIETEALSPEKEQQIMKVIKNLKKELAAASTVKSVAESVERLSKDINASKKMADEVHNSIQEKAALSQKQHEKMLSISKEVDGLKEKEKNAKKNFLNFKSEFSSSNQQLQQKLIELNKIQLELNATAAANEEDRQLKAQQEIEATERSLEEKMKKGGKITKDDLMRLRLNES